ncbi:MAG: SIP domain-containing protein [Ilumatobacteraceae bacterium]
MPTPLTPETVAEIDHTLEHFNANHADTVLLLARFAADCPEAHDAEAIAVDAEGVDLAVTIDGASGLARLRFDGAVTTPADVSAQIVARIAIARAAAGDRMPETSMEEEMALVTNLRTHAAEVVEIRDLSPNLREVVIQGPFEGFVSRGGDQFAYLFVNRGTGDEVPADYSMATWRTADVATRPFGAYYTVRSWDADARRITLWLVRHGHDDGVGGWAGRCQLGERVALWGPRPGFRAPTTLRRHLLVADESGFAAVAARIAELPTDHQVQVIVETVDASHTVELTDRSDVDIQWVFRGDAEPGSGTRLHDAVRALDLDLDGLCAFGAAESHDVSAIRRHLRRERAMPADSVSMTGYWRRAH